MPFQKADNALVSSLGLQVSKTGGGHLLYNGLPARISLEYVPKKSSEKLRNALGSPHKRNERGRPNTDNVFKVTPAPAHTRFGHPAAFYRSWSAESETQPTR
ncbi:hypothetical protein EVAR_46816_1 [Eumeta japonica]|uniref:Uncharacterized protein n=1 Tax=Eumeta variegata TaxID=151549 RepID=A0A4C1ZSI9_EUMVA|nr:hypothetical protein EVAR_46816_1 [Eumeta japonica]